MRPWFKYSAVIIALLLFSFAIFLYITVNAKYQNKLARMQNWDGRKYCLDMYMKSNDSDPSKLFDACESNFKDQFYIPEYKY